MANSKELFNDLLGKIHIDETSDEIRAILYLMFEHVYGLSKADILSGKNIPPTQDETWISIIERINHHEPVQYIIGYEDFYGRRFLVNPGVLIPRPETEQMIDEVRALLRKITIDTSPVVLDIGTGSGCIAITLAREIPKSNVIGIDISSDALTTAVENGKRNGVSVQFSQHDILSEPLPLESADIIVSNPPYIAQAEKISMRANVLDFEPSIALFVPDEDPLLFYKAIARIANHILTPTGCVVVEINERFGSAVKSVFLSAGFTKVEIKKDFSEKDRVVTALR